MSHQSKSRTYGAIAVDTGIVSILNIAPLALLAFAVETMGDIHTFSTTTDMLYLTTASFLFFGSAGFTIVGCRTSHPSFWHHLMLVAVGHWFVLLLVMLLTTEGGFLEWLITGPFLITPIMGLGGLASLAVERLDRKLASASE